MYIYAFFRICCRMSMHRQLRIRTLFSGGAHSDADTAVFNTFGKSLTASGFIHYCENESLFPPYGRAFPVLRKRLFRMSGRAFRRAVMCSSVRRKRLFRIFPGKLRGCRCCYMRFSFMFFRLPVSVSRISFVKIKSNRNCINMHSEGSCFTCDTPLSVPRGGVAWRMSDKEFLQHTG